MNLKPLLVEQINASLNNGSYARYLENLRHINASHLDIGAGVGQNVSYTESLGLRPVALEYDPDYLSLIPTGQKARGEANRLPFRSNCFDLITLMHVLEHLPEYQQTLCEIYRVIKPGGLFIIEVPNKYSIQELFNYLYAKYYIKDSNKHLGHCNFFYYKRLKALLEKHSFKILDIRITGGPFSSTYNSFLVNILRLLRISMMKLGLLHENDYDFINKSQGRLQFGLLSDLDRIINKRTFNFVEFIGFICIANK